MQCRLPCCCAHRSTAALTLALALALALLAISLSRSSPQRCFDRAEGRADLHYLRRGASARGGRDAGRAGCGHARGAFGGLGARFGPRGRRRARGCAARRVRGCGARVSTARRVQRYVAAHAARRASAACRAHPARRASAACRATSLTHSRARALALSLSHAIACPRSRASCALSRTPSRALSRTPSCAPSRTPAHGPSLVRPRLRTATRSRASRARPPARALPLSPSPPHCSHGRPCASSGMLTSLAGHGSRPSAAAPRAAV